MEDKTFGKMTGKIFSETFLVAGDKDFSFDFKDKKGSVHRFRVCDSRVLTKLCSLYDISYRKLKRGLRMSGNVGVVLYENIQKKMSSVIKSVDREVVLLLDSDIQVVSIVTEQHKQLPLTEAFEIVDNIAKKKHAVFLGKRECNGSYVINYEIGKNNEMSIMVSAYLGRNDAIGRSGISFRGGGNIFVCSNMIVPYIDKDVMMNSETELLSVKIVHTQRIEERLKIQLSKSFDSAKRNSEILGKSLLDSKKILMSRELQKHAIGLIRIKHSLPDKWNYQILRRLNDEEETLYGLSQALTYVGTHIAKQGSEISGLLQKLGGQTVLLGKDFVSLMERSIQKRGLKIPVKIENQLIMGDYGGTS